MTFVGSIFDFSFKKVIPVTTYDLTLRGKVDTVDPPPNGAIFYYSTDNVSFSAVGSTFTSTTCGLRATISNIASGTTIHVKLIDPISESPLFFGYASGTSCPSLAGSVILSIPMTSNITESFTAGPVA